MLFDEPLILIKINNDNVIGQFLGQSLKHFYNELDFFCSKNDNKNFGEWFSESGYLSMFINGIVRNDKERSFSAVQEYCVTNHIKGGSGRCDGFIEYKKDVILVEAKRQKFKNSVNNQHFSLEKWLAWDKDEIQVQLKKYLASEEKFFTQEGRYNSCYLMTIVFKIVKENKNNHIDKARKQLLIDETFSNRVWFYSITFLKDDPNENALGIEVYGSIEKQ